MGLFGTSAKNVALIDIRSSSVGVALAVLERAKAPVIAYNARIPLEQRTGEEIDLAVGRALEAALSDLVTTGAPLLRTVSGSGKTDAAYVTVTAPWQRSEVYSHKTNNERSVVFTREALAEARKNAPTLPEGSALVSEMVIATLLNGYEVEDPFGKRANRTELIMISSSVDSSLMTMTETAVRASLHQHEIVFDAFIPNAYAVFRDLYPHQRDFLIIDIGNDSTNVLLAKHGLLLSSSCIPHGMAEIARAAQIANSPTAAVVEKAELEWLGHMTSALGDIAKQEPLPRTIFLMAEDHVRDFLRQLLDAPQLRHLWLSDESLAILPILPGQFASYVTRLEGIAPDPALSILALAAQKRFM